MPAAPPVPASGCLRIDVLIVTFYPSATLNVIAVLFGLLMIVSGLFHLIRVFGSHEAHRVWMGISGLLLVVIGVLLLRHLHLTVALIGLIIGLTWIVQGMTALIVSFSGGAREGRGWWILFGAVSLIGGVVITAVPTKSVTALAILAGIWFIIQGLFEIAGGFILPARGHQVPGHRGRSAATARSGSSSAVARAALPAQLADFLHPERVGTRGRSAGGLGPGKRNSKGCDMAIGPVQLIVLGFNHPDFHGEVITELERLRESGTVRVIDALAVYKDQDGELEVEHLSNLTQEEAIELGSKIGALIGLGIEGEEGMEAGAEAGAEMAAGGINVFGEAGDWDVLEDIPNDSAAALIMLEHHWAVPLRDAIARAGGFRISDGFISPLDLIGIGLMSAEEARELHAMETTAAAKS